MSIAALIRDMAAAGAPAEAIALAVEAIEAAQASVDATRAAARDRKRKQRERERDNGRDSHVTVTGQSQDEPAPSLPPLPSPQTPQPTPPSHPHPGIIPHKGEALAKPAREKAGWPRSMPPPNGVTDEQWAGFVAHRTAKRQALTPRAYQLLSTKLVELADAGWPPGDMIDRAVLHGWTTVFPPDEIRNGNRPNHDRNRARGLLGAVLDAERECGARPGV